MSPLASAFFMSKARNTTCVPLTARTVTKPDARLRMTSAWHHHPHRLIRCERIARREERHAVVASIADLDHGRPDE